MGSLLPYVRREVALGHQCGLAAAEGAHELATVMMVDLVGFTRLAEDLAKAGPEGAEHLAALLGAYYNQVAEVAHDYQGDIVAIAGDGVIATFLPGSTGAPAERAFACATGLRHLEFRTPAGTVAQHRTLLTTGTVKLARVEVAAGSSHCIVSGPPVFDLERLGKLGGPGQITADAGTAEMLGARIEARQVGPTAYELHPRTELTAKVPWPQVTSAPRLEEALATEVAPYVRRLTLSGAADWLSGFRTAFVVFINLQGASLDRLGEVKEAANILEGLADDLKGTVYQFLADDKGISGLIAFGLPPFLQEDDARRAIRCAEQAHERLPRSLRPRSGIASGRVFFGACGGAHRTSFTIVGPPINLAARLMQAASDHQILVDPAARKAAARWVQFESKGELALKGRAEPVEAFTPQEHTAVSAEGTLFGRAAELGQLSDARNALVTSGVGSVFLVEGEPGIGKSHLLARFIQESSGQAHVIHSKADAIERLSPYLAWRGILADVLRAADESGPSSGSLLRVDALAESLRGQAEAEWLPLLADVFPGALAETPVTAQMTGPGRQNALTSLVYALLARETRERPTVIVIDDIHWMDSGSLALTEYLVRHLTHVQFVLGSRPADSPLTTDLTELRRHPSLHCVRLSTLEVADVGELITTIPGVRSISKPALDLIWEKAAGHPLYSLQLARALLERDLLAIQDGRLALTVTPDQLQRAPIPASLDATITMRVDRLPVRDQLLLRAASVLGRSFSELALADTCPPQMQTDGGPPSRAQLDGLIAQAFFRFCDAGIEFDHALTRDCLYESMTFAQRREMHERAAQHFEGRPDKDEHIALLGHHWGLAGQAQRAIPYLERAAERALRTFSNEEVVRLLEQARSLAAPNIELPSGSRSRWERQLGEATLKLARVDEARRHLEAALIEQHISVPQSPLALGLRLLAELALQTGLRFAPRLFYARGSKRERLALEADVYERIAEIAFFKDDLLLMLFASFRSLNAGEAAQSVREILNGYAAVAINIGVTGWHSLAKRYREKAVALTESQGSQHLGEAGLALMLSSLYSTTIADWDFVDRRLHEATSFFTRVGDRFRRESCLALAAYGRLARGELGQARQHFEQALATAPPFGAVQVHLWVVAGQLALLDTLNTVTQGRALADRLLALLNGPEAIVPSESLLIHGQLALYFWQTGDESRGLTHAETAARLIVAHPPVTYYLLWPAAAALEVLIEHRSRSAAMKTDRTLKKALRTLVIFSLMIPLARPKVRFLQARLAETRSKLNAATQLYQASLKSAESMNLRTDEARAHRRLSQCAHSAGARARHEQKAASLFEQIEASLA